MPLTKGMKQKPHLQVSPHRALLVLTIVFVLAGMMASCSPKGVHMPKHRKRRNCNCPTFSMSTHPTLPNNLTVYVASRDRQL